MMIRAVSFDLDGTLYSSQRLKRPMLWATFPRWRTLRVGKRVREELRGTRFIDGAALLRREAEIAAARLERDVAATQAALTRLFDDDVTRVLRKVGARTEAKAMLEALLVRGVKIAVISDRGSIAEKLAAIGLRDLPWTALVSADDVGALKPDPVLFQRAIAAFGVDAREVLHVGDRDDCDGEGARAAGCDVLIIDPLQARPLDVVITTVERSQ